MNPVAVYLCIFSTFLVFSLVSKGNWTHVIMTETKQYVYLWHSVCICCFLPPPQRNCSSTGCKKIRGQVDDCHPVSERRNLPVDNPDLALENRCGRTKLWMAEGTKSVKCRGFGVFVKLDFHVPYSFCLSAGDWNTIWCRGIVKLQTYIWKIISYVISRHDMLVLIEVMYNINIILRYIWVIKI